MSKEDILADKFLLSTVIVLLPVFCMNRFWHYVFDFFQKIWPYVEKEFFNTKLKKTTIYIGFVIGFERPYFKVSKLSLIYIFTIKFF